MGAGTITRFKLTAGGRTREYRTKIAEPEPGRVLTESDTGSSPSDFPAEHYERGWASRFQPHELNDTGRRGLGLN